MFKFFAKNRKNKQTKESNSSVYNGQAYRGVFRIGGDITLEGIYIRDGRRTFVCSDGVTNISKGVKIEQIRVQSSVYEKTENIYKSLMAGHCTPFTFIM